MTPIRLGVLLTHPVQYYAPLFRELSARPGVELRVFFAHRPTPAEQGEGFGVAFAWDVDLTGGYEHEFLENVADASRGHGFGGFDTPSVRDRVRDFDAFIVFGWHARTYVQAFRGCRAAGIPVLVRGDSQLGAGDRGLRGLAKRAAYPWFVRRFAACLATGARSEAYFRRYGARRVVRSPHFVDNEHFAVGAAAIGREAARAALGLPTDGYVVLFAGKLVARKRPLDLIEAAARVRMPVTLLIVGDGELRGACERACAERGVRAAFVGFLNQSQIATAYAAADVLVLPSDSTETWGLVVNEMMACGRPAIVSRSVGCVPDLVADGETGLVFPEGDIGALARAIEMAAEPERRYAMGEAARRRVAGFTPSVAADGVMTAVHTAVGREE